MPINRDSVENNKYLFCLSIFLLSILVRVITAEYIDIGGDNASKWRQAHYLVEGLGYTNWYQQTVRWGIMLPLAAIMKVFGLNPVSAYIQPIFFSSMASVLLFLIGQRLHSRALGLAAALATIVFPQMVQTGSQLWPGVFELGYLTVCVWLILIWIDTRSTPLLVLAALTFFLGWGCRVTMLYAAPGLALLIWLPTRDYKALLLCVTIFSTLCAIEWLAFWHVSGNPMGRIGILSGTHIQTASLDISFVDYLLNIKKLTKLKGLIAVWILCFIASIYVSIFGDKRWRAMAFLYLIHAFLLLYMVSSFSPLKLAMPVGTRFWGLIAPFGLLVLFKGLFDLKNTCPRLINALLVIIFLVFIVFTAKKIPPVNSIAQLNRDYTLLSPIMKERKPVLMTYEHWQPNFIEEYIISVVTGERGIRTPKKHHVTAAMVRNHQRMVALFVNDVRQHVAYKSEDRLKQVGFTKYLYTPPGASSKDKPAAEIIFGRKLHAATPLFPNSSND